MTAERSLLRRAATGLAWIVGSMTAVRLVSFGATMVLARLLVPEDFGILAAPLLLIAYLETVGDLGTGAALVRQPRDRDEAALVAFVANLGTGLLWALATWLLADPIATFFGRPDAAGAFRALAWVFPIKSLANTQDALLRHQLQFRRRAVPELGRAATKAVVGIVLATRGYGAWSLVWGQIAGTAVWTLLLWTVVPWRPWDQIGPQALEKARAAIAPMFGFGSQIVLVNVLAALLHHIDKVLIGGTAGVAVLGLYSLAAKLPEVCITTLTWALAGVAFPAFARSEGDAATRRRLYLLALRAMAIVALPTAAGLALLAGPAVVLAFGPEWAAAAPFLSWLALAAGLRAIGSSAGDLFKGAGRPDLLRNLALIRACFVLPALGIAAVHGRTAVAIPMALACTTALSTVLNFLAASRILRLPLARLGRELAAPAAACIGMAIVVGALGTVTDGIHVALDAGLRATAGVFAYAALLLAMSPDVRGLLRTLRLRRRSEPRVPRPEPDPR